MILYPEIQLDLRGNAATRRVLKNLKTWSCQSKKEHFETPLYIEGEELSRVLWEICSMFGGQTFSSYEERFANNNYLNTCLLPALSVIFSLNQKNIFKMGADFFSILRNAQLSVKLDLLPENESGFIAFPLGSVSLGSRACEGIYYRIYVKAKGGLGIQGALVCEVDPDAVKVLSSAACDLTRLTYISTPLTDGSTAKELMDKIPSESYPKGGVLTFNDAKKSTTEIVSILINCLTYIHSQKPDLQKTVVNNGLSHKEKRRKKEKGFIFSEYAVPITLVSWNFKKPVFYNSEGHICPPHVQGYWCGTGRTELRLIFKEAYSVQHKNVRESENDEDALTHAHPAP